MILIAEKSKDFNKYQDRYFENRRRSEISYPDDQDTSAFFGAYTTIKSAAIWLNVDEKELGMSLGAIKKTGTSDLIGKTEEIRYNFNRDCKDIHTENVVGYTLGTDRKDEWVVVIAHYDHLGRSGKKIFHGADDNASGSAAVMAMAQAFATASANGFKPSRSVAFVLVSAEEVGLYGSRYFVDNLPFPMEKVYAAVNVDMIGGVAGKFEDDPDYIYGWGYLSEDIVAVAAENASLFAPSLDFRMKYSTRRGGGSDHYYFSRNDIPALFYFSGIHKDYHTPKDTPDKLLYGRMEQTTRSIFGTVWSLANREEPLNRAE
jgi:hypothetical protein